jgi:hypothetical protein
MLKLLFKRIKFVFNNSILLSLIIIIISALVLACCLKNQKEIEKFSNDIYSKKTFNLPLPPKIFISDGCSCWPDNGWYECCVEHDLIYWIGGTKQERESADIKLKECVDEKGYPYVAAAMYYGVRIGGVWWLPTPFRWGFGWQYPQTGPPGTKY